MRTPSLCILLALLAWCGGALHGLAQSRPFDGKTFQGRIAYSADGNHNDEDDWAASPVALAIIAECGVKDRLVHFDYNCILPQTDPAWEKTHAESVLGAAEQYGYDRSVFFDCRKELDAAVDSIANEINASSADDPLYFIIAGPMEVPYLGIQKSDPDKRRHVYCISHSRWNDGYAAAYTFAHTKRSVIPTGIHWVQIRDQNALLTTSPYGRAALDEEWTAWHWMRDSSDPRVQFLWERMRVSTRADCSDAGMAYFLLTGDEQCDPSKLEWLLDDHVVPTPTAPRPVVRIEAECFHTLDGFEVESSNDRAVSHRLAVKLAGSAGRIHTYFDEPYAAESALFSVRVRATDGARGQSNLKLFVNGDRQESPWTTARDDRGWTTHTLDDVRLSRGDEITVEAETAGDAPLVLDYVELQQAMP